MRNIRRLGALALVAALVGCAQMGTAVNAGIPPSQVAVNHASQCPVVSLFNPACR